MCVFLFIYLSEYLAYVSEVLLLQHLHFQCSDSVMGASGCIEVEFNVRE